MTIEARNYLFAIFGQENFTVLAGTFLVGNEWRGQIMITDIGLERVSKFSKDEDAFMLSLPEAERNDIALLKSVLPVNE